MKDMLEEYGGLIIGILLAGMLLTFTLWCMNAGGPMEVLTRIFSRITFGS